MEAEWPADVALFLNLDQRSIDFYIKQEKGGEVEQQGQGLREFVSALEARPTATRPRLAPSPPDVCMAEKEESVYLWTAVALF